MTPEEKAARQTYQRDYVRRRFAEDPAYKAKHIARVRRNDARYRAEVELLLAAFRAEGCLICSVRTPWCLCAHHIDGATKEFDVGMARGQKFGPKRVAAELAKCVCLCMNCHAGVHAGAITLPAPIQTPLSDESGV